MLGVEVLGTLDQSRHVEAPTEPAMREELRADICRQLPVSRRRCQHLGQASDFHTEGLVGHWTVNNRIGPVIIDVGGRVDLRYLLRFRLTRAGRLAGG